MVLLLKRRLRLERLLYSARENRKSTRKFDFPPFSQPGDGAGDRTPSWNFHPVET
jgi:hypothetical protein